MDGLTAIMTAIFSTLSATSAITSIVSTKIYQNAAPPQAVATFPYILVSHSSGGLLNDAPYDAIDTEILITGVSNNSTQAKTLSGLIEDAFKNKVLSYSDGWHSISTVRQTEFFTTQNTIQQAQYHQVGAFYRFRATKAKE